MYLSLVDGTADDGLLARRLPLVDSLVRPEQEKKHHASLSIFFSLYIL